MEDTEIVNNIFDVSQNFTEKSLQIFQFQYLNNTLYKAWNDILNIDIASVSSIDKIPYLPVSFFKTHKVMSGMFGPEMIFESSGTTGTDTSCHYLKDVAIYRKSFFDAFRIFYGDIKEWCVIGLLPSYLERKNSSLVMMVDGLIKKTGHKQSGFYLYEFEKLKEVLLELEAQQQKTILIGVTFALLDFALTSPLKLSHTVVMETGGMKGRKREMTRNEVHEILCKKFGIRRVHSEYGMTELLSQAYSNGEGKFFCPPWMKVVIRNEEDPMMINEKGRGVLNIIDLANVYSCSFIATEDVGIVYDDGSFEVHGRIDNSDIRGCSLMVVK